MRERTTDVVAADVGGSADALPATVHLVPFIALVMARVRVVAGVVGMIREGTVPGLRRGVDLARKVNICVDNDGNCVQER